MSLNDIAIKVENISKRYRIGLKEELHDSLGSAIFDFIKSPFKNYKKYRSLYRFHDFDNNSVSNSSPNSPDIIWALSDVSFEVKQGEVLGIIGRNGAGKSTLLKILSKITDPTCGWAEIHGKVSSLLEVGTGFHHELTGRENAYLNGTILGMTKKEIDRKFDEIVEFSGVGKFIDTPVKRYSSGMMVRLAFSVAAHLDPEILIVDEVLAVGDAAFQKKCLGKMENVAKTGRTVLFVSHNMAAIQSLCLKAILIDQGKLLFEGTPEQTTEKYFESVDALNREPLKLRKNRKGGEVLSFTSVQFLNQQTMVPYSLLTPGKPVVIRIGYICNNISGMKDVSISISFYSMTGTQLFGCLSRAVGLSLPIHFGEGYTDCIIPKWPLKAGRYLYNLYAEQGKMLLDWVPDAGAINVETTDYYGSGFVPSAHLPGVLIDYTWKHYG